MNARFTNLMTRWSRPTLIVSAIYSAVCAAAMTMGVGGAPVRDYIAAWGSFPVSIVIAVLMWPLIKDANLSRRRRLAWRFIFAATVLDLVASVGWGYSALTENVTFGSWPDVLYLFYYPCFAIACGLFYLELGGRLNSTRSVIDFTPVVIGFGSLLWFTARGPPA